MKQLILISILFSLFACCKKKTKTDSPSQYFNCNIDGKYFTYTQSSFSNNKGLSAGTSGSLNYVIIGRDMVGFPQTQFIFTLIGNHIPTKDTILIDTYNYADVEKVDSVGNSYRTNSINNGKIIFTERTNTLLKGIFYFDAFNQSLNKTIHITNGQFSIILN